MRGARALGERGRVLNSTRFLLDYLSDFVVSFLFDVYFFHIRVYSVLFRHVLYIFFRPFQTRLVKSPSNGRLSKKEQRTSRRQKPVKKPSFKNRRAEG